MKAREFRAFLESLPSNGEGRLSYTTADLLTVADHWKAGGSRHLCGFSVNAIDEKYRKQLKRWIAFYSRRLHSTDIQIVSIVKPRWDNFSYNILVRVGGRMLSVCLRRALRRNAILDKRIAGVALRESVKVLQARLIARPLDFYLSTRTVELVYGQLTSRARPKLSARRQAIERFSHGPTIAQLDDVVEQHPKEMQSWKSEIARMRALRVK